MMDARYKCASWLASEDGHEGVETRSWFLFLDPWTALPPLVANLPVVSSADKKALDFQAS